jgi:hypothetical protein
VEFLHFLSACLIFFTSLLCEDSLFVATKTVLDKQKMLVEEDNTSVDNVNSIRDAIRRSHKERFNPAIIEGIVSRRVFFKWLPVTYVTDLEQGAMYWVAASIISMIIPIFPLVSLYQYWFKDEDDDRLIVPRPDNAAVYAMLIWVGICFTIGSWLFHRAVRHPPVPSLFKWKHICTDELHAMWWFFFGTLPSVPCTAIYCYHNGALGQYGLALAIAVISSIVMELAVFASYPVEENQVSCTHIMICTSVYVDTSFPARTRVVCTHCSLFLPYRDNHWQVLP